jgi:hypothetical protein
MTAVYYIHPETLSINIREFYQKYDTALKNLRPNVEDFIKTTKNVESVEYVNKKSEIQDKSDGYYLKLSNKYPNRISVYEKTSNDIGYVFSNVITDLKKILVFSLLDLSSAPDGLTFDTNENNTTKIATPHIELLYLDELKERLQKRLEEVEKNLE